MRGAVVGHYGRGWIAIHWVLRKVELTKFSGFEIKVIRGWWYTMKKIIEDVCHKWTMLFFLRMLSFIYSPSFYCCLVSSVDTHEDRIKFRRRPRLKRPRNNLKSEEYTGPARDLA